MIVKDEAHVIRRCIESVRPLIDSWVIVDTGSTDGTQEVVREALSDLPGELHERPWRDFGHNRSEAIQLAKGVADYLLFIDADDSLEIPDDFRLPRLTEGAYEMTIQHGSLTYRRISLVDNALPWRYAGVLHEYPACDVPYSRSQLDGGLHIHFGGDGGRSKINQAEKYAQDAEVLERALSEDPDNPRHAFYLAQSYRDAGQPEKALAAYDHRATMGGFDQELYCALLEAARLARQLLQPAADVVHRYLRAHESRPSRAEALGELAFYLRENGERWPLAYLFAEKAIGLPPTDDVLFVGHEWYQWRCQDEYATAAYWVGEYEKSRQACESLLRGSGLPAEQRPRVTANLNFALQRLGLPEVN
ncbi:MAG: family 2 glycosyl transferase [Marmoricola sp.]|jgi:glycosyltransferase involved in cell wall biosynthesis|nr:family 2 glycosyl transferase [Marmoricola sp.]